MKKRIFLVFLALVMAFSLTSCKPKENTYTKEDYTLKLDIGKDELNILQFTDIHMGQMDKAQDHYDFMKKTFDKANEEKTIDLIVVTGDLFTFATKDNAIDLFNFFDTLEVPWTVTFGNHDEQCYFSIDWLTTKLNALGKSNESNCLFKDIQDDDVKGNANFVIDVTNGNEIIEKVIIMDSNRYYYGDYNYYDYMDETQVNWYKKVLAGYTGESLMFFHIPLPEFTEFDDSNNYELGEWNEKACVPEVNIGFYDVIKELGSTKGMFVGHDHINNYVAAKDGIVFSYGVKSTNRVYYNDEMLGATLISKTKGVTFTTDNVSHILNSYE